MPDNDASVATVIPAREALHKPELVLVIDDEPTICWALERSLKSEGYAVVLASSAEEGLRIAREQKPALVLLDVRLPREDGLTALPKDYRRNRRCASRHHDSFW